MIACIRGARHCFGDVWIARRRRSQASMGRRGAVDADRLCVGSAEVLHRVASALVSANSGTPSRWCRAWPPDFTRSPGPGRTSTARSGPVRTARSPSRGGSRLAVAVRASSFASRGTLQSSRRGLIDAAREVGRNGQHFARRLGREARLEARLVSGLMSMPGDAVRLR